MGTAFFNLLDYQAIKPEILLAMFGLASCCLISCWISATSISTPCWP